MHTVSNELKLPDNYVDMSVSEMEYSGGFDWGKFLEIAGLVTILAGFGTGLGAGLFTGTAKQFVAGSAIAMVVGGSAMAFTGVGIKGN